MNGSSEYPNDQPLNQILQNNILDEIIKAFHFPNIPLIKSVLGKFFLNSTRNFSDFFAEIDGLVKEKGISYAARTALHTLCRGVCSTGEQQIPKKGPLMIASNHPGTYDSLAIISRLPRNDVKVVVSGIPFFKNLPNSSHHFLFSSRDTFDRMNVIRQSIRHLQDGGALLIFPSGRIDPDPALLPGAESDLKRWSRSIEIFIRKIPQMNIIMTITSEVLSKEYIHHPFAKLFRKDSLERRRVMEFLQVIQQMVATKQLNLMPKISFASPINAEELISKGKSQINELIFNHSSGLLSKHMQQYYFQ